MASESASAPVNGNYAPTQTEGYTNTTTAPSSGKGANDIPQDEVGWYFVEQYYTTLSRSPEKLFLFYNKRSQFVSGVEEEKVSVCIGQKAINERIKELDFQDCKVRITNVDSQGSDENIVIQVIGEISNKHAPHRKFVQTFVLAGQTNGYFVLNDIFRYILDEEPELEGDDAQETAAPQEPVPAADDSADKGLTSSPDPAAQEAAAAKVDEELEEVIEAKKEAESAAQVNGTPVPEKAEKTEAPEEAPAPAVPAAQQAPAAVEAAVVEEVKQPEKPKEPEPTKATPSPAPKASPAPATPAAPPKPAAPKTWASLAASAHRVATPAVPAPASVAASSQSKPAPPASQASAPATAAPATTSQAPASASQTPTQPAREPSPANSGSEGWQTAGADHSKRQSRAQNQNAGPDNSAVRAYIKNVFENIDGDALKKELSKYGEVVYFDVSRPKNCAFVDFATSAGFQAAVNANPHTIGDSQVYVEERRPRPNSYGFPRGGGGGVPRGRGDRPVGQGRGFKQDGNGRGGFPGRGRGAGGPRGRGQAA